MLTGNQCKERYWNNNVTKELVVPYFVKGLINTYGYTLSNKIKKNILEDQTLILI